MTTIPTFPPTGRSGTACSSDADLSPSNWWIRSSASNIAAMIPPASQRLRAITSTAALNQPGLNSTNFSPKASLSYDPNKEWNITANFGEAYRYPTVTELYQNITVAGVATFANPKSRIFTVPRPVTKILAGLMSR